MAAPAAAADWDDYGPEHYGHEHFGAVTVAPVAPVVVAPVAPIVVAPVARVYVPPPRLWLGSRAALCRTILPLSSCWLRRWLGLRWSMGAWWSEYPHW